MKKELLAENDRTKTKTKQYKNKTKRKKRRRRKTTRTKNTKKADVIVKLSMFIFTRITTRGFYKVEHVKQQQQQRQQHHGMGMRNSPSLHQFSSLPADAFSVGGLKNTF